ncbi:A disintegrin and metalloproteinase with thrombospondin motifs 16 [Plakobranchus ocellatus]|uniref:A disintegrin and metalloproteinase with thrombospondin motifs 16 n=1 Tax=Plakobranchus ocellatus TaxID=259542 RepID=A0AAV3ZS46_9GAST|nr:A disintegrin and metalloproteinase with thrombospondin motifs 16 [Plakobranchus ocellatus]
MATFCFRKNTLILCFLVTLITSITAENSEAEDVWRSLHHRAKRQAAFQGHQVSSSGSRAVHSSSNQRHFVSPGGRPYYEYQPYVSSSGRGREGVHEGPARSGQTYDYPFGRGQINYVDQPEEQAPSDISGSAVYDNLNSRSGGNSGRSSSRSSVYEQQQRRQYSTGYHSSGNRGGAGYVHGTNQRTGYRPGTNQGSGYSRYSTNQRRGYNTDGSYGSGYNSGYDTGGSSSSGYSAGGSYNSGYNRPYSSRSNDTRTYSRRRNIDPRYGYRTNERQAVRSGTRTYPQRTWGGQTTGYRTYSRGSNQYQPYAQNYRPPSYRDQRGVDQCPQSGVEVLINGMECHQAVRRFGLGLCYQHEFSSAQCCQACRPRRDPNKPGCEYGDRSRSCSSLEASNCYIAENRRVCCQTCERHRRNGGDAGCEYGDRSIQCDAVRRNPGLCYNADNRRMCCQTCARYRDESKPDCPWGDHNAQQCRPFERNSTQLRINCYSPRTRNVCCNSCQRVRDWVPDSVPAGCEYGDRPVTFVTNQVGNLTCATYFNYFSSQHCTIASSDVARYCCYTCHRYLSARRRSSRG